MVEVRVKAETRLEPDVIIGAATDFSDRRPRLWPSLDPEIYRVEELGERSARVMEGESSFGGLWALEAYDWSEPGRVRAEVQESNVFEPGSSWELRVVLGQQGGSEVEWVTRRRGKGKGRILTLLLRIMGKREMTRRLKQTLEILEREHPQVESISRPPEDRPEL
jgi:hypothetical protein